MPSQRKARVMRIIVAVLCVMLCIQVTEAAEIDTQPRSAMPIAPIGGILAAFRDHRIVAMGDGISHGDEFTHRFRQQLLRDPRFAELVNDIVFETGNALYQPVIDRFIAGEDVSYAQLRKVWEDTTQVVPIVDAPIFEEF